MDPELPQVSPARPRRIRPFSNAYRGPDRRQGGLDWDKLRADYEARVADQIARGVDDDETRLYRDHQLLDRSPEERERILTARALRKPPSVTPRSSPMTPQEPSARKADVPRIVKLYVEEMMKPGDIAQLLGLSNFTVITWLKRRGVYDPKRHLGATRGRQFPERRRQ